MSAPTTATAASAAGSAGPRATDSAPPRMSSLVPYLLVGVAAGVIFVRGEVVSWYRIQEMFRFDAFRMYGILGSAALTAFVSLRLLRWTGARAATGEPIALPPKVLGRGTRYWLGGSIFGVGWALTGACPGPLYALIGTGPGGYLLTALAAVAGAWTYGRLRGRLPH